jgi:hypothetical protein
VIRLLLGISLICGSLAWADEPLFDMAEMCNASTLDVEVLQEWHNVEGKVPTRQKLITIRVGELWPGQDYRVPVRMIVPADRKAKGFHLTGGHQTKQLQQDAVPRGVEVELLEGGVGLVYTVVQTLESQGQHELGREMYDRFIQTLETRYSIQYWGWPASLMRAVTAAYAETDYFEEGKVALSGGSKNGASPSVAIIHDERMTALHATVSPPWESPLRLCDRKAWDELNAFNQNDGVKKPHGFLGGTFGPIYNDDALAAGHTWEDLQKLARRAEDQIFISKNFQALEKRDVDMLFHPGTHDYVCYDIAWGGAHYPEMPTYYIPNSGHGKKQKHPGAAKGERNRDALLLRHFFPDEVEPLLSAPVIESNQKDGRLLVTVKFSDDEKAESGRIFWMYDRAPDGSAAYLREMIPSNHWKEMIFDSQRNAWMVEIDLEPGRKTIDVFCNHRKTIRHQSKYYASYISSPYTRVMLNGEPK